jgi:microcystin-dependent protein
MADVASSIKDWSTTAASNAPSGSTIAGAGIDDNLRQLQATVRAAFAYKGPDLSVSSTVDVGAVDGSTHDVQGSGTISSFGSVSSGIRKRLRFNAAVTVTHNATTLAIPGATSLSLVAGDIIDIESLGGGNWIVTAVTRYNGRPVIASVASEVVSTATGRVSATNVDTAISQLQTLAAPSFVWLTVSGTDTLTATGNALLTSLQAGDAFRFVAAGVNTGAVTLNISSLGAKSVLYQGQALVGGELFSGYCAEVTYDGTSFHITSALERAGEIKPWAGATAPGGYLFAAGQSVSRTTYARLFAVIGTTYGSVDGASFTLPDLRGRTLVGRDDMGGSSAGRITLAGAGFSGTTLGASGGVETVTLTQAQIPSHSHTISITDPGHSHTVRLGSSAGSNQFALNGQADSADETTSSATTGITASASNTGGSTAHNNVPPAMVVNYVIKF